MVSETTDKENTNLTKKKVSVPVVVVRVPGTSSSGRGLLNGDLIVDKGLNATIVHNLEL